jgi:hypothetical protein
MAYGLRWWALDERQINEPKLMKQQINEQKINACDVEKTKLRTIIMSTMVPADK